MHIIAYLYLQLILISPIGIGVVQFLSDNEIIIEWIIVGCMFVPAWMLFTATVMLLISHRITE